ncbi:MAG TPA: TPM domain-containing protein [Chitinophagaceae bacterium]|nr:TPM domain-containing protein [Chitinophagaceae bacterium]HQX97580.1 TPM domain-containing protein [Chitinophagaceae bacterium]
MKHLLFILTMVFSFCASAQMEKVIATRPSPPELVNDYTKTLTAQQEAALEAKLVQYDDSTSNQIAVVIVESTDNYSIEDAAIELGRKWGVGNKEFNNGIVVLVAKGDRKVTIQAGYGLEGAISDLIAKSIIDNEITPNFKQGNYYRGLDEATDNIIKAAEGRYKAPANYGSKKKKGISISTIIIIIIILIVIFSGAGPGGGTYVSRGGFGGWSGGGGGSGWSGGSSGGGFGGFGGGSFGGGGASGSW